MSITLNSNNAATKAAFNLSKASDSLRKSLARLSSGNRIVDSNDDPGGMSVAYKLNSRMRRTEAVRSNVQNSISFLQVQDGALQSAGSIVSRMSELRAMAQDVTKNADDAENYSKEFLELQKQLSQIYREKFNGVELFAVSDSEQELPPDRPALYKGGGFDLDGNARTNFSRRIYTHDGGQAVDGNVSIGVTNFEDVFKLGALDTRYVATFDGKFANLSNASDLNVTNYSTAGATQASGSSSASNDSLIVGNPPVGAAYFPLGPTSGLSTDSNGRYINYAGGKLISNAPNLQDGEFWHLAFREDAAGTTDSAPSLYVYNYNATTKVFLFDLPGKTHDYTVHDIVEYGQGNFSLDLTGQNYGTNLGLYFQSGSPGFDVHPAGTDTSTIGDPWGGFSLPGEDTTTVVTPTTGSTSTSGTAADESTTPDQNAEVFTDDGFLSSILFVSMGQFTSVIERIADARAENGAEQNRLLMVDELLSSNMTNLEAAYGRIMDADIALESARFAQQNVLVQASAAMVAQANQISSIALTILGR